MLSHTNNDQQFTHTFQMNSAYSADLLPFTNYTYDFKGIIDYIFYPKGAMKPLGILGHVSEEWLKESKIIGCPHPHIPSDHFPLLVEFGLTLGVPRSPPVSQVIDDASANVPRRLYAEDEGVLSLLLAPAVRQSQNNPQEYFSLHLFCFSKKK